MARHIWTNEQIKYLKRIANGKPKKVTLEKINKKFNLNLSLRQLNNCMSNNNREDEAQKWYKEVEANRARAIADAIEAGTIVEVAKWSEPDLYKQMIATRLSKELDMLKAFAMLDEVLSRQRGNIYSILMVGWARIPPTPRL